MNSRHPEGAEALAAPLYLVAVLLLLTPLLDFFAGILPLRLGSMEWRFASVGLLSGFLLTPLLGVVLAMAAAHLGGHLRVQRVLAIANFFVVVFMIGLFGLFVLDILQLRSVVQPAAKSAFESAAMKAVLKHLSFDVALAWLAWRGIRMSRWRRPEARRQPAAVVIG
jgi:hypothetical protein